MSRQASEPLCLAITIGDYKLCQSLVEDREDINSGFPSCSGCTPLLYSLQLQQFDIAQYLLSQGAAICGRTCQSYPTGGYTVSHYAAAFGLAKFLRLLLDRVDLGPPQLCRPIHPLHLAVINNQVKCAKLLLEDPVKGKTLDFLVL